MSKLMYKRVVGDAGFKDAEHWITLHPNGKGNGKGTPALINGAGQIIGGAGGKLNGKVVSPKSKSTERRGTESQHAPAIWLGPAKPEQKQASTTTSSGATSPATTTAPKTATPPNPAPAPVTTGVNPHKIGSTGKANGHAWGGGFGGAGNDGYFSISPSKRGSFNEEQANRHEARVAAGQVRWSVSSSSKDQTRATIVHELAHALGLRENVQSTKRLAKVMDEVLPDRNARRDWIRQNISEYATTNINEFDAELAAMVTDPDYKRGTLPKQFEEHVDWLFERVK